jgi:endonuclease/exonuclease/phosphatase (EEP) superfamily protein YafD
MFSFIARFATTSLLTSSLAIITLCSLAGFFSSQNEVFELLSHLRMAYALALLILCIVAIINRERTVAFAGVIVLLINLVPIVSLFAPQTYPSINATASNALTVKLLEMNLWGGRNHNHAAVISLVHDTNPDIIGFSEITATWLSVLRSELKEYRYSIAEPRYGGIALFSRVPFKSAVIRYSGPKRRPRVFARLEFDQQNITMIFSHTLIPIHTFALRNLEFDEIASEARNAKEPVLLAGDLNCTPWSFYFDKLKKDSALLDSEQGFGPQPSWNVVTPLLPIDHLLTSSEFVTTVRRVCRPIGSDHFPVYAEVRLTSKSREETSPEKTTKEE